MHCVRDGTCVIIMLGSYIWISLCAKSIIYIDCINETMITTQTHREPKKEDGRRLDQFLKTGFRHEGWQPFHIFCGTSTALQQLLYPLSDGCVTEFKARRTFLAVCRLTQNGPFLFPFAICMAAALRRTCVSLSTWSLLRPALSPWPSLKNLFLLLVLCLRCHTVTRSILPHELSIIPPVQEGRLQ